MFIEKSLFEARHREDKFLFCGVFCLRHDASQVHQSHGGIEVKMQGRLVTRLAVRKASELFGIAEDELDLKPGFVKAKDFCGGKLGVGRTQDHIARLCFISTKACNSPAEQNASMTAKLISLT